MSSKTPSAGTCSPVIEQIEGITAADFPDLIAQAPGRFSHLFASLASGAASESGQNNARWSILFGTARAELRLDAQGILHATGLPQSLTAESHFLSAFAKAVAAFPRPQAGFSTDLPFVGGWSFYLSYELARIPAFIPGCVQRHASGRLNHGDSSLAGRRSGALSVGCAEDPGVSACR
ncbi:MAG: hypothetical protein IE913_12740 [Halothiobacillus sp.]|nr:hypothetical protein [Halothiobacillus sp.]